MTQDNTKKTLTFSVHSSSSTSMYYSTMLLTAVAVMLQTVQQHLNQMNQRPVILEKTKGGKVPWSAENTDAYTHAYECMCKRTYTHTCPAVSCHIVSLLFKEAQLTVNKKCAVTQPLFPKNVAHWTFFSTHEAALKYTVLFCSTIGKLEPSYVIRKFLDAQRIHNLTAYLQALHRQSLANADHTTLLLNCYTKLKDSSKLEEFIKVAEQSSNCGVCCFCLCFLQNRL